MLVTSNDGLLMAAKVSNFLWVRVFISASTELWKCFSKWHTALNNEGKCRNAIVICDLFYVHSTVGNSHQRKKYYHRTRFLMGSTPTYFSVGAAGWTALENAAASFQCLKASWDILKIWLLIFYICTVFSDRISLFLLIMQNSQPKTLLGKHIFFVFHTQFY